VSLITSAGPIGIASSVPADTSFKLYNNSGTLTWNGIVLAAGSSLSGTTGKLAKFTAANAVGDSICSESGATLSCVTTISASTLTGTLSTASQPNVTTMAGLTTVGTVGTGVWQGTKVGLAYGGTNADLSATGGTSQFLRQNSVGAAVTVVRPAVSDLSDASNVALLNASNTFTGTTQTISGASPLLVINATSGSGQLLFQESGSTLTALVHDAGTNNLQIYTNNTLRWGINAAGDWTLGPGSHIADSVGTPTIASGFGTTPTIDGSDYAFLVTAENASGQTGGVVNFGHTFTSAPICVAVDGRFNRALQMLTSTTQMTITHANGVGGIFYVLCRGY
jgi:hypothetical protein